MRFPLVGVLSAVATALGLYGLYWYENLTKDEKREADEMAAGLARRLYDKGLDELTGHQLDRIQSLVKEHFGK
jgi:hypothetical protein